MTRITLLLAVLAVVASPPATAAGAAEPDGSVDARPVVVATTSIVGDVLSEIAGDNVSLTVLMERGENPHAFDPTPRQIAVVERADILFVNGFGLESGLMDQLESADPVRIVSVSDGVDAITGKDDHDHSRDHDAADPHVWFDPTNVVIWADNIERALSEADPANAVDYTAAATAYRRQLRNLDGEIKTLVTDIPSNRKKIIVDHVSLGYFARAYGFEIVDEVIPSTSDQSEPSVRDIANTVSAIRNEGIRTIFVGGTAGKGLRDLMEAVAQETGEDVEIRELLSGSLAPQGTRGDTYLDYMRLVSSEIAAGVTR